MEVIKKKTITKDPCQLIQIQAMQQMALVIPDQPQTKPEKEKIERKKNNLVSIILHLPTYLLPISTIELF